MYKVFNMGHRFEIYTKPENAEKIIEISAVFNLEAKSWTLRIFIREKTYNKF